MSAPEKCAYHNQWLSARQDWFDAGSPLHGAYLNVNVDVRGADEAFLSSCLLTVREPEWRGIAFLGEGEQREITVLTHTHVNACDAAETLRREFAAALERREGRVTWDTETE